MTIQYLIYIRFFSTPNFLIKHKRNAYSDKVEIFLSKFALIFVLWQEVQKLCVEKKWISFGL